MNWPAVIADTVRAAIIWLCFYIDFNLGMAVGFGWVLNYQASIYENTL